MGRWAISLVAVAAALAAPASLAQVVLAPTVFVTHELRSNTIETFTVTCPPGYLAASAGVASPAPGTTLLGIRPVGLRAYAFRFGNPVTNPDQRVAVAVACRKVNLGRPPVTLKLRTVKLKVKVPPGKLTAAGVPCPSRTAPAGGGSDLSPSQRGQGYIPGLASQIAVRKVAMHLYGFSFSVRNNGRKAQTVVLYGTCLTVVRSAGARAGRLGIRITTFRSRAEPGHQRIMHVCPRGWFSLATGYSLRSPVQTADGAAAIGAGGRWWVTSDGAASAMVDLQLVCGLLRR